HVYECEVCGELVYRYHSCRNRHCNLCQTEKAAEWLAQQQALLLSVPYFLVTFTLPKELRTVAYTHQQMVYNLLFRSAAEALQELAGDPRFVGGQVGVIGVLHTWNGTWGIIPMSISSCRAVGLTLSTTVGCQRTTTSLCVWSRYRNSSAPRCALD
ncbi:MAG: transposase zinc-binding domain-containing protein, partial [Caldilineaceae bacterium]|nr:transposase zinc-binding domain-containing protein [Caldilineaceae bacterium]